MIKTIGLTGKGIIIATQENRIADWVSEYINPFVGKAFEVRYVENEYDFSYLIKQPRIVMAFIEIDFFGDETIRELDYLRKQNPNLQVILFSASDMQPEDTGRYMCWGADSFISLREEPSEINEQINAIFKGLNCVSNDVLDGIKEYNRLSVIPPHFTPQEIEITRCVAKEKTMREIGKILGISENTVRNHLAAIYRKCGVNSMVGLVKAALSAGVLMIKDLIVQLPRHEKLEA